MEPVIKSAVAHLWFVSIHPFDDGKGRMARPIADCQLARADRKLSKVLDKARFWEMHITTWLNERQIIMINILLGNFIGKLHSSKWATMTKVHRDTALRDIQDLVEKGILSDSGKGGENYELYYQSSPVVTEQFTRIDNWNQALYQ